MNWKHKNTGKVHGGLTHFPHGMRAGLMLYCSVMNGSDFTITNEPLTCKTCLRLDRKVTP